MNIIVLTVSVRGCEVGRGGSEYDVVESDKIVWSMMVLVFIVDLSLACTVTCTVQNVYVPAAQKLRQAITIKMCHNL